MQMAASSRSPFDFEGARSKIAATEAKQASLKGQLLKLQDGAAKIQVAENTIANLERQMKLEEEEYFYYQRHLEQMRLDRTIDLTRRNNISDIQEATLVRRDPKSVAKTLGGISAAGVALGILLALLSDYVFNPSVKRPKELESALKLPVFATIPDFGRRLKDKRKSKDKKAVQKNGSHPFTNGDIAPWDESDPMLPYYEALRDRLVMSYAGDLHKPKVVGITSCDRGAGVTRLATGLAASLSRDAERNILLVGLERNKVAVSGFAKGKPTNGLDAPPSDSPNEKELVAQNLYSLATTGRNLAGASVVQSFSELLPKLKICDYDFIIFDLPPLTQTSGSLRLASQMERTLLVVEAEETGKDKVKRAQTLLQDSSTRLATVLNKTHFYGPKSINSDL
jgi:Mrp family chromosome partitioning ATPase